MTTPTPTSSPSARYNAAPGKGSAIVGKLIAVGAVVFVVLAGIVIYQYYQKVTSATTTGFSRIDDRTLTVSVDVTRDNVEIPSYCIITALNYGKAEVGRREFLIEPGGDRTKRFSVDIPTRDVAVAGTVYGCSDNPPSYLKPLSK